MCICSPRHTYSVSLENPFDIPSSPRHASAKLRNRAPSPVVPDFSPVVPAPTGTECCEGTFYRLPLPPPPSPDWPRLTQLLLNHEQLKSRHNIALDEIEQLTKQIQHVEAQSQAELEATKQQAVCGAVFAAEELKQALDVQRELEEVLATQAQQIAITERRCALAKQELDIMGGKIIAKDSEMEALRLMLNGVEKERDSVQRQLISCEADAEHTQNALDDSEERIEVLEARNHELQAKVLELQHREQCSKLDQAYASTLNRPTRVAHPRRKQATVELHRVNSELNEDAEFLQTPTKETSQPIEAITPKCEARTHIDDVIADTRGHIEDVKLWLRSELLLAEA